MCRSIRRGSNLQAFSCLLVVLLLFLAGWSRAEQKKPMAVVVDYVIDGDSLVVKGNGKTLEVRLWGIDAPEHNQPYSDRSREALKDMTVGQGGTLYAKYRDRYDRYVSVLLIDGQNINQELVRDGHAWVYKRYCDEPVCGLWQQMQAEAKANRYGLWGGSDPIPPWRWKAKR